MAADLDAQVEASGVRLVTSDAHAGLVAAIGALPGAPWQWCRAHHAATAAAGRAESAWDSSRRTASASTKSSLLRHSRERGPRRTTCTTSATTGSTGWTCTR